MKPRVQLPYRGPVTVRPLPPLVQSSNEAELTARLVSAVQEANLGAVNAALDAGATDPRGAALRLAAELGDRQAIVRALVGRVNYVPEFDTYDSFMHCPLLAVVKDAIHSGDLDYMRWIIEGVIRGTWQPHYDGGDGAIYLAVFSRNLEIADYLLSLEQCHLLDRGETELRPGCSSRVKDDVLTQLTDLALCGSDEERWWASRCLFRVATDKSVRGGRREIPYINKIVDAWAELDARVQAARAGNSGATAQPAQAQPAKPGFLKRLLW